MHPQLNDSFSYNSIDCLHPWMEIVRQSRTGTFCLYLYLSSQKMNMLHSSEISYFLCSAHVAITFYKSLLNSVCLPCKVKLRQVLQTSPSYNKARTLKIYHQCLELYPHMWVFLHMCHKMQPQKIFSHMFFRKNYIN